jgi:hypothetical protein
VVAGLVVFPVLLILAEVLEDLVEGPEEEMLALPVDLVEAEAVPELRELQDLEMN